MITIDKDGEESAISREFDITIPFEFRLSKKGEAEISIFPSIKQVAHDFVDKFKNSPFSPKAIDYVRNNVTEYINTIGYEETPECKKYYHEYTIYSLSKLNQELILDNTKKITNNTYKNKTTFDIEALIKFGHTVFATIVDDTIVSIAATHSPTKESEYIEIGTETSVTYRGNGYAKSNVAALTRFLLLEGKQVAYSCSNTNKKSIKIAESAGFIEESRHYYYVGRRK